MHRKDSFTARVHFIACLISILTRNRRFCVWNRPQNVPIKQICKSQTYRILGPFIKRCGKQLWSTTTRMKRPHFGITNITYVFKILKCTLVTDNRALNCLLILNERSRRLNSCGLRLAEFDFEIIYKKGAVKHHAEALVYLLTRSPIVELKDDDIPALHLADENDLELSL